MKQYTAQQDNEQLTGAPVAFRFEDKRTSYIFLPNHFEMQSSFK